MADLVLFAGLGNPGAKYAGNRHNVGFMAVDRIAEDHGLGPWRSKFQGQVADGRIDGVRVVLLKPQTMMNLSGQSVGEVARFHKLDAGDVVVFHDEIDLAPGRCRVKDGGGHAGHNGLRSIHAHLGEGYRRVRIGVGHPGHKDAVPGYVLRDFPKADADWLDDLMRGISDGAPALAAGDAGRFMNAVSLKVAPPRSSGGKAEAAGPDSAGTRRENTRIETSPGAGTETPRKSAAQPEPQADHEEAARSPLQRLVDRFR